MAAANVIAIAAGSIKALNDENLSEGPADGRTVGFAATAAFATGLTCAGEGLSAVAKVVPHPVMKVALYAAGGALSVAAVPIAIHIGTTLGKAWNAVFNDIPMPPLERPESSGKPIVKYGEIHLDNAEQKNWQLNRISEEPFPGAKGQFIQCCNSAPPAGEGTHIPVLLQCTSPNTFLMTGTWYCTGADIKGRPQWQYMEIQAPPGTTDVLDAEVQELLRTSTAPAGSHQVSRKRSNATRPAQHRTSRTGHDSSGAQPSSSSPAGDDGQAAESGTSIIATYAQSKLQAAVDLLTAQDAADKAARQAQAALRCRQYGDASSSLSSLAAATQGLEGCRDFARTAMVLSKVCEAAAICNNMVAVSLSAAGAGFSLAGLASACSGPIGLAACAISIFSAFGKKKQDDGLGKALQGLADMMVQGFNAVLRSVHNLGCVLLEEHRDARAQAAENHYQQMSELLSISSSLWELQFHQAQRHQILVSQLNEIGAAIHALQDQFLSSFVRLEGALQGLKSVDKLAETLSRIEFVMQREPTKHQLQEKAEDLYALIRTAKDSCVYGAHLRSVSSAEKLQWLRAAQEDPSSSTLFRVAGLLSDSITCHGGMLASIHATYFMLVKLMYHVDDEGLELALLQRRISALSVGNEQAELPHNDVDRAWTFDLGVINELRADLRDFVVAVKELNGSASRCVTAIGTPPGSGGPAVTGETVLSYAKSALETAMQQRKLDDQKRVMDYLTDARRAPHVLASTFLSALPLTKLFDWYSKELICARSSKEGQPLNEGTSFTQQCLLKYGYRHENVNPSEFWNRHGRGRGRNPEAHCWHGHPQVNWFWVSVEAADGHSHPNDGKWVHIFSNPNIGFYVSPLASDKCRPGTPADVKRLLDYVIALDHSAGRPGYWVEGGPGDHWLKQYIHRQILNATERLRTFDYSKGDILLTVSCENSTESVTVCASPPPGAAASLSVLHVSLAELGKYHTAHLLLRPDSSVLTHWLTDKRGDSPDQACVSTSNFGASPAVGAPPEAQTTMECLINTLFAGWTFCSVQHTTCSDDGDRQPKRCITYGLPLVVSSTRLPSVTAGASPLPYRPSPPMPIRSTPACSVPAQVLDLSTLCFEQRALDALEDYRRTWQALKAEADQKIVSSQDKAVSEALQAQDLVVAEEEVRTRLSVALTGLMRQARITGWAAAPRPPQLLL